MSVQGKGPRRLLSLQYYTAFTACIHLISAILVLVIMKGKDMKVPLNEPFLAWPTHVQQQNPATNYFTTGTQAAGSLRVKPLIASFFFLSFGFQACAAWFWKQYAAHLDTNRAALRWCEYSLSASVMFVILFLLNGTLDAQKIALACGLSFCMMAFGWLAEESMYASLQLDSRSAVRWFIPHTVGWVPFAVLWGVLIREFTVNLSHDFAKPPPWIYTLYASQSILMFFFGGNQLWQAISLFRTSDARAVKRIARRTEAAYITLSLFAKTGLCWVLFWGFLVEHNIGFPPQETFRSVARPVISLDPSATAFPEVLSGGSFEFPAGASPGCWNYNATLFALLGFQATGGAGLLADGCVANADGTLTAAVDGDVFALLQNDGTISKTLTNLTVGGAYVVDFWLNARLPGQFSGGVAFGDGNSLSVYSGVKLLWNQEAVYAGSWRHITSDVWIATAPQATITFASSNLQVGTDRTLFLDELGVRFLGHVAS
jgi:hypothetical protein